MAIYQPKSLAVGGFIASVFASLSLPLFGFVLS
jgi:ABC-type multidrug transport system fused ATPase/permease subunit